MSILEKALFDSSLNNKNVFLEEYGPLSKEKNIFGKSNPNVIFNDRIKSVNIPKCNFTNYLHGKKSPLTKTLNQLNNRIKNNYVNYDVEFEIKKIDRINEEKYKIKNILHKTYGNNSIDYNKFLRLKYRKNPEIQFFFLDDLNGNYEVIIVDIYHLVLAAIDRERHEEYAKPWEKYALHCDAYYCISNVFQKTRINQ